LSKKIWLKQSPFCCFLHTEPTVETMCSVIQVRFKSWRVKKQFWWSWKNAYCE